MQIMFYTFAWELEQQFLPIYSIGALLESMPNFLFIYFTVFLYIFLYYFYAFQMSGMDSKSYPFNQMEWTLQGLACIKIGYYQLF